MGGNEQTLIDMDLKNTMYCQSLQQMPRKRYLTYLQTIVLLNVPQLYAIFRKVFQTSK